MKSLIRKICLWILFKADFDPSDTQKTLYNLAINAAALQEALENLKWQVAGARARITNLEDTHPLVITGDLRELWQAAIPIIHKVKEESVQGTSGEYKRHVVFSRLRKEFPGHRKRDLAFAIELAVRNVLS